VNESLLVNTLGHSAGVLIFGIFLVLLLQDRTARRLGGGWKPIFAASLALAWNLTSLLVLGSGDSETALARWTVALGFSVLSLLPAVLFDLCLERRYRALVAAGYALSAAATLPHLIEVFRPDASYHRWALGSITAGFGGLTIAAAALVYRERRDRATTSRLVGTMSLFLLAMSFVHLGSGHAEQIWSQELAFHHAAIPLALLVLLQDYRFVLLDAFLRFLANVLLAAVFVSGAAVAWQLGWLPSPDTPFHRALLLAGACLLLIVFAVARGRVQRLLTHAVFRRQGDQALLARLRAAVSNESDYLASATREIGRFFGAEAALAPAPPGEAGVAQGGIEACIPVGLPSGPARLWLGRRTGGRRYLSEDLDALRRAAAVMAEQIDQFRESEMRRLVSQAELRALQSQIHPHFLFNALNTLYGLIPREARGARDTVLNLADIFRYFLETKKTLAPLEEELRIVKAYLEVERLRLGPKLRVAVNVDPEALAAPIPILSIQPLVENAVRHGIAPLAAGGEVAIEARMEDGLRVAVRDTGRGFQDTGRKGVGLENVERRLELCYGGDARLRIASSESGSEVSFTVPAAALVPAEAVR
jgi:two-component system LytT family sensor kinase